MSAPSRPAWTSLGPGARNPGLLLIGHGSRDPRHSRAMSSLAEAVREAEPESAVEVGFLDLCGPSVAEAYGRLLARGGATHERPAVRVVPLFLNAGNHVRQDVPQALAAARRVFPVRIGLSVAAPLGPDPLLEEAFGRRIREAGCWPDDPALDLLTAGATRATEVDPAALAAPYRPGTTHRIVLARFLAPGRLPDRAVARAAAAGVPITEPLISAGLGPAAELVRLVRAWYGGSDPVRPAMAPGTICARA
jgi:sirohydrochlorin ferrochelatase